MKLVGLMVSLLIVAALFYFAYGKKEAAPGDGPAVGTTLGAPPPTDVASNPKAARQHTERQMCLANCAAEARTCETLAAGETAKCGEAKEACDGRCP
jgi:hypothetical protein